MRVSSEPVWTMFRPGLDHTLQDEFTIHVNRTDTKGLGKFTSEIFVIISGGARCARFGLVCGSFTPRPQTWQEAERQRSTCCLNTADAPGEPAATKPAGNQHRPE